MKKALLLTLAALLSAATFDNPHHEYGRAQQQQGKYVFFHAEPVQAYERAFSFIDNPTFTGCPNAQDYANAALKLAQVEAREQGKEFDAIILQPGERDLAIKFKTASEDNALERAEQREGKYTFILAEPVTAFEPVTAMKATANDLNLLSKGICLNTEQIVLGLIKKASKGKPFDAVVYSGTTAQSIQFK